MGAVRGLLDLCNKATQSYGTWICDASYILCTL